MIPKKLLLLSAFSLLVLSAAVAVQAQESSSATAVAPQAESSPSIAWAFSDGNYLGITGTEVTRENMSRYSLREPRGVAVTRVSAGSPAARAGLMVGDVILRFDGEQVTTYRKLQRLISEAAPEQTVRLAISRNGSEQELTVTLARRADSFQNLSRVYGGQQGEESRRALERLRDRGFMGFGAGRRIGVSTTELTKQLADYFGVSSGRGVLVTSVSENSPAARAGLKAGDVITDVDGQKVETAGDLSRAINRKTEGDVTLTVVRDRGPRSLRVTPEKREPGAISITPDLLNVEPGAVEIDLPTIDIKTPTMEIRLPQIKQITPITIPNIKMPKMKIKPEQLRMLKKLQSLESLTEI